MCASRFAAGRYRNLGQRTGMRIVTSAEEYKWGSYGRPMLKSGKWDSFLKICIKMIQTVGIPRGTRSRVAMRQAKGKYRKKGTRLVEGIRDYHRWLDGPFATRRGTRLCS